MQDSSTTELAPVDAAEERALACADRYRALCERVTTWSAGEHRTAIPLLLSTAHLWRVAAAQARQVNDPRADDWGWAAGSVAGIAELHALEIHLDQAAAELGGIA